jgi:hypothetical protein
MNFENYMQSLDRHECPVGMQPCLQALWYEAAGAWDTAHEIVQDMDDAMAARVHAYLHRREGDIWNSNYWHRRAGTEFPEHMSEEQEWEFLVRQLLEG